MAEIQRLNIGSVVRRAVADKPVLAICVGMQALLQRSEENGGVDCLNILPGEVRFFGHGLVDSRGQKLKVPHMGWDQVKQSVDHPLWHNIEDLSRFYFVHSYYAPVQGNGNVAATCNYGVEMAAAVYSKNLFATQFHPEKSADVGLQLLKNFVHWGG